MSVRRNAAVVGCACTKRINGAAAPTDVTPMARYTYARDALAGAGAVELTRYAVHGGYRRIGWHETAGPPRAGPSLRRNDVDGDAREAARAIVDDVEV